MNLLLFALFLVCIGTVTTAAMLWRANRALTRKFDEMKITLDRTSKILIEKNLELSDQNIAQQKELESKDDFVNIVSHQLRTPITEMKWNVQSILFDKEWPLTPPQRERVETLYASVDRMVRLINDILHMVSVDQGSVRTAVTPYEPDMLLAEVAHGLEKDFADSNVAVSLDLHFSHMIQTLDQDSFVMAVSNIIENAFHYTLPGGTITVASRVGAAGECIVEIRDSGMGITPQQQKRLYMKFKRSEEAIRVNPHGSGLGLYIVKKILEKQGGSVSIASVPNVGTTCTLTLR
jgi:signal transduction histidine kinase